MEMPTVLLFVSIAVINTMTKSDLRKERICLTHTSTSQSVIEGSWNKASIRNLEAGTDQRP